MAFDLEGARKAGYSDADIATYLAGEKKFDAEGARKAGYTDADIIEALKPSVVKDVAKQSVAGLVEGAVEGIPAAVPRITELLGGAVTPLLKKFLPAEKAAEMDKAESERQNLKKLIAGNYEPTSVRSILPTPETSAGEHARNITGAVAPAIASIPGSVPRAALAGLGAGGAVEATKQVTDNPLALLAAGAAGGAVGAGVPAAAGAVARNAPGIAASEAVHMAFGAPPGVGTATYAGGRFLLNRALKKIEKAFPEEAAPEAAPVTIKRGRITETARVERPEAPEATPEAASPPNPGRRVDTAYAQTLLRDLARQNTPEITAERFMRRLAEKEQMKSLAAQGADLEAEPLLRRLADQSVPKEAPVDLRDVLATAKAGDKMEAGMADLVRQLAQGQRLLSQRSPVIYGGAPEPQLALPAPTPGNRPPVAPPAALPGPQAPMALPAPPVAPPAPPVAPPAPPVAPPAPPGAPPAPPGAPPAPRAAPIRPQPAPVSRPTPPPVVDPFADLDIPDFLRRTPGPAPKVEKTAEGYPFIQAAMTEKPPLQKATATAAQESPEYAFNEGLRAGRTGAGKLSGIDAYDTAWAQAYKDGYRKGLKESTPAPKASTKKAQKVAEDATEDWVVEHDKAEMGSPFEAANAIADDWLTKGKTFKTTREQFVGYLTRILKDKSEVAGKLSQETGIDGMKLRKTLWALKDRGAALAKIDQLSRIHPKHEDLIRSTLEPKVTKWWRT